MYSMKQACEVTNLTYETLKYYCNEGLVPNVKRDKNNHRIKKYSKMLIYKEIIRDNNNYQGNYIVIKRNTTGK